MPVVLPSADHRPPRWRLGLVALLLTASSAYAQTLQFTPDDILKRSKLGAAPAAPSGAPNETAPPAPSKSAPQEPATAPPAAPEEPRQPAQGYLYVEPNQARFETLIDAPIMLRWLRPEAPIPPELSPEQQKELVDQAAKLGSDWCRLGVNGKPPVAGSFRGVSIVKGSPGRTEVFAPDVAIPTSEAMVGFIWEFPTPPGPDRLTVEWRGYNDELRHLPIRVFFGVRSELLQVSADISRATWHSRGRIPMQTALAPVPQLVARAPMRVHSASIVWILGGIALFAAMKLRGYRLPGGALPYIGTWILGALLTWPLLVIRVGGSDVDVPAIRETAQAQEIVAPLLRNVYTAFDQRSESEIYDVLARSADGPLLRQLYLETMQALTLKGREGTRVTISEFDATVASVSPASEPVPGSFTADCQWTALGKVGHWGHAHTRLNRYNARVTVAPIEADWKLIGLEVTDAKRL